ncbi:Gldg family protein [Pseudobacter ginsenosidimutans]|nr:Gldg family protein [Pseudobacter ginsenosidimutans]
MVIQVAKAELRNLFYSPVAWFMLVLFMVLCAYFYTTPLFIKANWQDILLRNRPNLTAITNGSLTRDLFLGEDGFFTHVLQNLYLIIPLLTMGLIGREVQSGTIKLLYSSPIKIRQIVLGKFLAIMIYNLLLVMITGIFFVSAMLNVKSVDYGMLLSAALGFYLLICTYAAIGAFMSSLSTYQIVTALGTFVVILVLTMIGKLWQQYDIVRDLTYFLFLSGRTEKMLAGLITSRDVIYFLVLIAMFLLFTMFRLKGARELKPWYIKTARYIGATGVVLIIGYVSSRPAMTLYWDTTQNKVNTIHRKTQQIIKEMGEDPIEVTLYSNLLGKTAFAALPEKRSEYIHQFWDQYLRFKPNINFKYEYYYDYDSTAMGSEMPYHLRGKSVDQMARKKAEHSEWDLSIYQKPAEIRKKIDLRSEYLHLVMKVTYKGRSEFLRTSMGTPVWPGERQVAAAFKKLLYPEKIPQVYFITGHYERSTLKYGQREYGVHTSNKLRSSALVNNGFNVDTISLDNRDIPGKTDLLVLADPKSALSDLCQEKIRNYISQGGNMIIMGEPGKQSIVNPVLSQLGLQLAEGTLINAKSMESPDMVNADGSGAFGGLMYDPSSPTFQSIHSDAALRMAGAAAFLKSDSTDFNYTPLFHDAVNVFLKKGSFVLDSAEVLFNATEGDLRELPPVVGQKEKPFTTMLALQRFKGKKDQRIIVSADADCLSNFEVMQVDKYGSFLYSWTTYGNFPVYLPYAEAPDKMLTITGTTAKVLSIVYTYILPAIVLLAGSILLIRRKRK